MELVVMRIGGDWSILTNGRRSGRYAYEVDAVDAALRLADRLGDGEEEVHVVVQDRFGELRRVDHAQPGRARAQGSGGLA